MKGAKDAQDTRFTISLVPKYQLIVHKVRVDRHEDKPIPLTRKEKGWVVIMKKLLLMILSVCFVAVMPGCSNKSDDKSSNATAKPSVIEQTTTHDNKETQKVTEKVTEKAKEEVTAKPTEKDTEKPTATPTKEQTEKPTQTPTKEPAFTVSDMSATMYVISSVNVRKGPGTEYDVIGNLSTGLSVEVTGKASTGWYRINYNGSEGFCSDSYLSNTKPEIQTQAPTQAPTEAPVQATETPTNAPTQAPTEAPVKSVSYDPNKVVQMAIKKCQQNGIITTEDNLNKLLKEGKITQEVYDECYPMDGMENSYFSMFINVDLNKASDITGYKYGSVEAIANDIAGMILLENGDIFNITYAGTYKTNNETYYEFRCHR